MGDDAGVTKKSVDLHSATFDSRTFATGVSAVASRWVPERIGTYRILRLLGEGGMGAVYEAEQDQPRRAVALKVIKPGFANAELLRRFDLESQALARLQHPGIAQVFDAGTADSGFGPQPYFAMELIRGEPLNRYAESKHLTVRERLELIAKICDAVHHAHQRSLIHRDLKPGNILVDDGGQPKILDFGVARVTDSDAQATLQTSAGQIVGTLAYMSPEQITGDPLDIDTRSDIYALGVILYECLASRLPYNVGGKLHEAILAIQQEEPARLSSISRIYRGDIDIIVAKALEKDKAKRYTSAAELASDIRHHLRNEPIFARPLSPTYQLQKFARRHKGLVASLTAVLVVLTTGIVVSTSQAIRARRAEQAALVERDTTQAVLEFLQKDLLAQASVANNAQPDTKPDPEHKVRTALDRAAARLEGKFATQPLVEASVRDTIGSAYIDLSLDADAERQYERAVELRRRVLGEFHPDTLSSMNGLATAFEQDGQYAKAEPLYTKVLEARRRILGEESAATLHTMSGLAATYVDQGKYAAAEAIYAALIPVQRRVLGEEHLDTLKCMTNVAAIYHFQRKYAEAEPVYTRIVSLLRRVTGEEHPLYLLVLVNLAELYNDEEKYVQAEPLYRQALAIQLRVLGKNHRNTVYTMTSLAEMYRKQGQYREAEAAYVAALEAARPGLGEQHPYTVAGIHGLASTYRDERKYAAAEALYATALAHRQLLLGSTHPDTLRTLISLAEVRLQQGKYDQVETATRTALTLYEQANPDGWERYRCQNLLGASLAGQKRYSEAEPLLVGGFEGMLGRQTSIPTTERSNLENGGLRIVNLYKRWGKPAEAAGWQEKLQHAKLVGAAGPRD